MGDSRKIFGALGGGEGGRGQGIVVLDMEGNPSYF